MATGRSANGKKTRIRTAARPLPIWLYEFTSSSMAHDSNASVLADPRNMLKRVRRLLNKRGRRALPVYREVNNPTPRRLVLTQASMLAIRDSMAPEIERGHEGIAYLFGITNGTTTVVVGAIRPESRTSSGSFNVSSIAMARVVRAATNAGLQVIGQIHTHPGRAYHSGGDEEGARIAYEGYISIVVPDYGRRLPSLEGGAFYFYRAGAFSELSPKSIKVISGQF